MAFSSSSSWISMFGEQASAESDPITAIPLEPVVSYLVQWVRLGVEVVGAGIATIGVVLAVWLFAKSLRGGTHSDFRQVRLVLAHYLVVALEFQLAADILSTAISPTWDQIGKLGAIAVIRTVLNFFLMHEMHQEELAKPGKMTPGLGSGNPGTKPEA